MATALDSSSVSEPLLYRVEGAMQVLDLSRTVIMSRSATGASAPCGRAAHGVSRSPRSAITSPFSNAKQEGSSDQATQQGVGGLHWDQKRQRWIATAGLGYDGAGKRMVKRGSGRTKTEAKAKLKEVLRDYEDGLAVAPSGYTVAHAVNDWLVYGQAGLDGQTVTKNTILCRTYVIPALGVRKLRDLSADDVDRWLSTKAKALSTSTL